MGLFCIATKNSIDDDIKSAVCNLNLFLEDSCSKRSEYLLQFAQKQIQDAITRLKETDGK